MIFFEWRGFAFNESPRFVLYLRFLRAGVERDSDFFQRVLNENVDSRRVCMYSSRTPKRENDCCFY